ncbi:DegV family protein with EDD domain [Salirhabdus euzebyi]|uniref:DegV family protein with EDD domain n=1 Tax=Salirhabdus euzebyi TaxID=394506 RepID=A0A841PU72_9BACI|nr:DegV family protein [Salirhabdus euzebyi]MBB6452350.1 DegV family protein with EDD domain [Salirhabdus euzebyi]
MKKIAWITDSTCGLPEEYIKEKGIFVLPMNVILNGISYKEDIDLSKEEIYEKLQVYGEGAKTSQPSYGEFIEVYEKVKEEYDCGIAIHASSELTGTYQSSVSASQMTGFPVEVIDSRIGSYPLGKMIQNGIEMQESGKSFEEIVEIMKAYPQQTDLYLLPASFDQLKRSGRVSTAQTVFANLMNINLLLKFDDGKVVVDEKIRAKKRAKRRIFDIVGEAIQQYQLKEVCVLHAGVADMAHAWKEELESIHQTIKFKVETLVPVAGVHTGYGTMGVAWLKV